LATTEPASHQTDGVQKLNQKSWVSDSSTWRLFGRVKSLGSRCR
jgi:hypothetical protein